MARGKIRKNNNSNKQKSHHDQYKKKHVTFKNRGMKRKFSDNLSEKSVKNNFKEHKVCGSENYQLEIESSEESDIESDYKKLLKTFHSKKVLKDKVVSSEDSASDDEIEVTPISEEIIDEVNVTIEDEIDKDNEYFDENSADSFVNHFNYELDPILLTCIQKIPTQVKNTSTVWPVLGNLIFQSLDAVELKTSKEIKGLNEGEVYAQRGQMPHIFNNDKDTLKVNIKPQIIDHIEFANKGNLTDTYISNRKPLTDIQNELFSIIGNYQDCFYSQRNFENAEEIRFIYCLHAINHVLKTRTKILHHNARLSKKDNVVSDDYRDQGLVRPKVLIIVPFRDAALKIVKNLINILVPDDKGGQVINKTRFMEDFTGRTLTMPKKNPRPDDYEKLFAGNTDDTFRIGLSITKKTLKLYTEFYASDIIIASPLGLRVVVGAAGEPDRDYDFLASIEVLIMDQAEQFLMQNWDHLLHVADHFHLQPKDSHGTDFSRVRLWSLNGHAKYYRQSLIFSSYITPELNSLFNKRCLNYAGKIKVLNPIDKGSICHVLLQLPHIFQRFDVNDVQSCSDTRFDFFINKVLLQFKDSIMKHTLVYVPSYFDFVRLRNFFKKEEISFVQICEYSKEGKIARARDMFFHADAHFLLYSERFHHFHRIRLKGIRHIIFYQPPNVPHFYPEICNLMQDSNQNPKSGSSSNMTITVLYSRYDVIGLASLVGTQRASRMCASKQGIHMFMTGE